MNKFKEIRPIVVGLVENNNKILVQEGYDKVKKETFYRILGGGIEFTETSTEALIREFHEETKTNIEVLERLDIIENIFVYQGRDAHEIMYIYRVNIPKSQLQDEYLIVEGKRKSIAKWVDKDEFLNGSKILYPEIIKNYI